MPDNSLVPCAACGHKQADHNKRYAACYECPFGEEPGPHHDYERLENLEYLEWCYEYNLRRAKK